MKKSMIAAAVVATAFAASANAGYFVVTDASYSTGGTPTFLPTMELSARSLSTVLTSGTATDVTGGSANNVYNLNSTAVSDIVSSIGAIGAGNAKLTYFGMESSSSGPGYFGFVFQNNATSRNFSVTMANANLAAGGVFTNFDTQSAMSSGTFSSQFGVFSQPVLGANAVYVAIFAGVPVNTQIGAGTTSDSNFDVEYLTFNGTGWATAASGTGVSSSSLNYATYAVPVPAPALLAGAGLIGAAAIRRRMAKKA